MFPSQQQIAAAARAQFDTQVALYREFSQTALDSMEKLTRLNIAAVRASMEENSALARQMLTARDMQQAVSVMRTQTGPSIGKAIAYGNHVVNIASDAQADLTRATEVQLAEAARRAGELVDEAARNAPPGTENLMALVKVAIGSATAGYEEVNRSTRRAVQTLESNVNAAVNQIVQPAPTTGG
ncbi:MAG TPA: phasin family protein [Noviherbaspirillum sp.]|nr:phasin family protein [Noviherbaspirillum sp.]